MNEKIKLSLKILKGLSMLVLFIGLPFYCVHLMTSLQEDLEQAKYDEYKQQIERMEERQQQDWCEENKIITKNKQYGLIDYYNMSCEEIKFNVENWVKEYSYTSEYAGGGLFSTRYETVQKYHGVGHLKLLKQELEYTYPENKSCWYNSGSSSNNYLEKDFIKYYTNNCIINQTHKIG